MEYGPEFEFDDGFDLSNYVCVASDSKVGESVSSYSTVGLVKASIETKSPVVNKTGAFVTTFDMDIVMALFGQLE